ncbi:MAG: hypothetical protein HOW73_29365 [Polyangiaceae bacterium]|nr:hypothetical protein [Polyangiaceae bacterium]
MQARARAVWRDNGLSIVLIGLFLIFVGGQLAMGFAAHNDERVEHGLAKLSLSQYVVSGDFIEATFENWESEFLQMGLFVLLTVKLRQKGSSESKPVDEPHESDEDPTSHRHDRGAPWPVRRGGVALRIYRHSLSTAFFVLFAFSFVMHALGGARKQNAEHLAHGRPTETLFEYLGSSQFWFESFQNWQSEFLAVAMIVVLSIFLRQYGSPQSKPVAAPHRETGG